MKSQVQYRKTHLSLLLIHLASTDFNKTFRRKHTKRLCKDISSVDKILQTASSQVDWSRKSEKQ